MKQMRTQVFVFMIGAVVAAAANASAKTREFHVSSCFWNTATLHTVNGEIENPGVNRQEIYCPVVTDTYMPTTGATSIMVSVRDQSTTEGVQIAACTTTIGTVGGSCGTTTTTVGTGSMAATVSTSAWLAGGRPYIRVSLPPISGTAKSTLNHFAYWTP